MTQNLFVLKFFQMPLIIIILSFLGLATGEVYYNVTTVTSPILQEDLFNAYLYHEVWTTVHFVEIKDLKDQSYSLGNHITHLLDACQNYHTCNHEASLKALRNRYKRIETKINVLLDIGGQRKKRGLVNAVGTAMKFLFGTMSTGDAEKINEQINDVYNNTANIAKLMKNQTYVIKSTVSQIKNVLSDRMNEIHALESIVKNGTSQINTNSFNSNLMENIVKTEVEVDELNEIINIVVEGINDGKSGIVSPLLVSPENLINALIAIKKNLSFKDLPFSLSTKYYSFYMQISLINIILSRDRLIYVIHTPIPTGVSYKVFKFTPVPMSGWTKYYIYDNLSDKPIAISLSMGEYTIINADKCSSFDQFKICEITYPIHRLVKESSCYSHILKDKQDNECTKRYFDLNANYILSLQNGYSWYILPKEKELITITCNSNFETIVQIENAVILEIAPHCQGQSDDQLFLPRSHTNISKIYEYKINVSFVSLEEEALANSDIILPSFNPHHVDTDQIISSADRLDDLSDKLNIISENHTKNHWLTQGRTWFETLVYVLAALATLYILYKIQFFVAVWIVFKWLCQRCCPPIFINCINPVNQPANTVHLISQGHVSNHPVVLYSPDRSAVSAPSDPTTSLKLY